MVGIDWSDGGGMNLLDIRTKEWNTDLLAAAGEGLAEKLGSPLSPNTVVGHVSEYMQERSVQKLVIGNKHNSIHSIQQQHRVHQQFQNRLSCMSIYHEKQDSSFMQCIIVHRAKHNV